MSNSASSGSATDVRDSLFDTLADDTRREALRLVNERSPAGIEKDDLAFQLAAVTNDKRLADVTDDEHQRALLECHHWVLPALKDADLLAETADGSIVTSDHRAFADGGVVDVIADAGAIDADDGRSSDQADDGRGGIGDLDAIFRALADERRRTILSVLGGQYHALSTETLARDVAAREAGTTEREVSEDRVDTVLASLVHVHLPLLNDAGLIGYDADGEQVSYEGHPIVRAEWIDSDESGGAESVAADSRHTDVRTLEGRDAIISTGQSLCERADDELFLMFTTTGLLEEGCFRRIEDAVDRGVDVYLGSRDPRVRDLVRERVPEVVLWEPQFDWLNLPPEGESVGRLVFADREAVMLGTIGRSSADDAVGETAILGDGPHNGLVVLMRQMLGSRIDQLDSQSEDARSQFPL